MKALTELSLVLLFSIAMAGCSKSETLNSDRSTPLRPPLAEEVTPDSYLSGKEFCQTYPEEISQELGQYVRVPLDYSSPASGTMEIYVYSRRTFDPNKPTYLFVDGGPGQNTHGQIPEFFNGEFNELHFDQRGLGCSAPSSFELYKRADLYSIQNTVLDMEQIRQHYGLQSWAIYGISYGTVPATLYASQFPEATTSTVLEGVYGDPKKVHLLTFKAEKMNFAIAGFNPLQKNAFSNLMFENSSAKNALIEIFYDHLYRDVGMRKMKSLLDQIFTPDGKTHRNLISQIWEKRQAAKKKYPRPQRPMTVDSNIFHIISCRNLGYRHQETLELQYDLAKGFSTAATSNQRNENACDQVGVPETAEAPIALEKNPVTKPIYYFQGAHDGATLAAGALEHWQTVAKGSSYFMLAQNGGHSPNLERLLRSDSIQLKNAQLHIFRKSLLAEKITKGDLYQVNLHTDGDQKWFLYRNPRARPTVINRKINANPTKKLSI